MREISEAEAFALAGETIPPVVAKIENEATESAVALKRFPTCFVLGISCDLQDRFQIFAFDTEADARRAFEHHAARMAASGTPFFD